MNIKELFPDKNISSDLQVAGLTLNSKEVKPGYVFFAVKGEKTDGNNYIQNAVENGAAAIVSENDGNAIVNIPYIQTTNMKRCLLEAANRFYQNPSQRIHLTGVTGTNGKTTFTYMLESVYKAAGKSTAVIGTVNYRINAKVLAQAINTTPEPLTLGRILKEAADGKVSNAVIEVSSQALAFERTDNLSFDTCVFLNLSQDHLDYHKTMECYLNDKLKLFKLLSQSAKQRKTAVVNFDDPCYEKVLDSFGPLISLLNFGLNPKADINAKNIKNSINGVSFDLGLGRMKGYIPQTINLKLFGTHNVYNALAVVATALNAGVKIEDIKQGLESLTGIPGRMTRVQNNKGVNVFVDFAHSPDALENVIKTLAQLKTKKLITVFGCGGNKDKAKRPLMGQAACKNSDYVFVTSDNPRFEEPRAIINDIVEGLSGYNNYEAEPDRKLAIEKALNRAKEGDIVLLAGKGHEEGQIINGKVYPFSDFDIAREILSGTAVKNV